MHGLDGGRQGAGLLLILGLAGLRLGLLRRLLVVNTLIVLFFHGDQVGEQAEGCNVHLHPYCLSLALVLSLFRSDRGAIRISLAQHVSHLILLLSIAQIGDDLALLMRLILYCDFQGL